jgi:hypothetical protein
MNVAAILQSFVSPRKGIVSSYNFRMHKKILGAIYERFFFKKNKDWKFSSLLGAKYIE